MSDWMRNNRQRSRKSRSGNSPKAKRCFGFRDEIQLTRKPKNLLFVPGEYTSYRGETAPYWTWLRHKFVDPNKQVTRTGADGSENSRDFMASFMCTRAGTPNWEGECPACDRNNPRMDPEDRDKRIGTSSLQHWTVIDLSWYYKTTNKWGDVVWKQPSNTREEQKFQEEGYEKVFGKRGYLNFGPLHSSQFDDNVLKTIERMCGGCEYELGYEARYDGDLEPALFKCSNCNATVEDLAISEWTGSQIDAVAFGESDVKCNECGHVGVAKVEYGCTQCTMPTAVDLFDCVIPLSKYVSKTENGKTQSSIQIPPGKQIVFATDFKLPNGQELMRVNDAGENQVNPIIQDQYKPIDFKGDLFKLQFDPKYQLSITNGALDSESFTPRKK